MIELTLAELAQGGEHDLGPTAWLAVAQTRIDLFADATGDAQWIHVDRERAAAEAPLGTTIAHGMLTLSLVPGLMPQLLRVLDAGARINYGLDRVRFLTPVPEGAELRVRGRLHGGEPRGAGVRYRIDAEVELRGAERPAAVATFVTLALPAAATRGARP